MQRSSYYHGVIWAQMFSSVMGIQFHPRNHARYAENPQLLADEMKMYAKVCDRMFEHFIERFGHGCE